jgi:hypothetical protein
LTAQSRISSQNWPQRDLELRRRGGTFVPFYLLGLALIVFPLLLLMGGKCRHKELG